MAYKDDALLEITTLMKRYAITVDDIQAQLTLTVNNPKLLDRAPDNSIMSMLFGYIGGIFIFSGICAFIAMYWLDLTPAMRVLITLGCGFCSLLMGLSCLNTEKYIRAATPLFFVAVMLQPFGLAIAIRQYTGDFNPDLSILFICLVMAIQQGALFIAKRHTSLALTTAFFGLGFVVTAFDMLGINHALAGSIIGVSLLSIAYAANNSKHASIAPLGYFTGSILLLTSVFDAVYRTPYELCYFGLTVFMMYLSTTVRSRILLIVTTVAMLWYIGYFTATYFSQTLGWPLALIIGGIALIGMSSLAVKINNKYIKQPKV